MQRTFKVNCSKCGKRQGNCFAFCVVCGSKLPQKIEISLALGREGIEKQSTEIKKVVNTP